MSNKVFTPDFANMCVVEKAEKVKPVIDDYYLSGDYATDLDVYEQHIASLRELSAPWLDKSQHDRELVEGKDFELMYEVKAQGDDRWFAVKKVTYDISEDITDEADRRITTVPLSPAEPPAGDAPIPYVIYPNDKVNSLLAVSLRVLSTEQLIVLRDCLTERTPAGEGIKVETKETYYPADCANCGWFGSSSELDGGGPIADTGDYFDTRCPACGCICDDESEPIIPVSELYERIKKAWGVIKNLTDTCQILHIESMAKEINREQSAPVYPAGFVADVSMDKPLTECMAGRDTECNHPMCPVTDEDCKNGKYCTLPLYDWRK